MPWLVTHCSRISASRSASDSIVDFCLIGMTNAPWPVTIRNCVAASRCFEPEIKRAWSGAGTCHGNFKWASSRKWSDRHGARGPLVDHDHAGVLGDRLIRIGSERLGSAADRQHDLASADGDRDAQVADLTFQAVVRGAPYATMVTRLWAISPV
jgi:hypothetical protein